MLSLRSRIPSKAGMEDIMFELWLISTTIAWGKSFLEAQRPPGTRFCWHSASMLVVIFEFGATPSGSGSILLLEHNSKGANPIRTLGGAQAGGEFRPHPLKEYRI